MKQYRVYFKYYAYTDFEAEDDEQAKEIGPTLDPMSEMIFAEDWKIDLLEDGAFCKEVE